VFLDLTNKQSDPFELKLAGHVHYHSNNNKVCDPLKHDFHKDMRERAVLAMNPVFKKLHNNRNGTQNLCFGMGHGEMNATMKHFHLVEKG
jgi:hypothetical protein